MKRDLAADLKTCEGILYCGNLAAYVPGHPPTVQHILMPPNALELLVIGPAAIRRAIAAEGLLRRLVATYYDDESTEQFTEDAIDIAVSARELLEGKP
jgi:hypothetical protein